MMTNKKIILVCMILTAVCDIARVVLYACNNIDEIRGLKKEIKEEN